jgi:RNA polymerase sigma-70 factor (ECF subfamily)
MIDDAALNAWFCEHVLALEPALTSFIRYNWRIAEDVIDLRQDIYERVLAGSRQELPMNTKAFVFTVARNHLINQAVRARIVSFDLVANLESEGVVTDLLATERHLDARDQLRWARDGLEALPPRCREVVRLRKVEGLTTKETAERLGIGIDTVERQLTMGMRALVDFMLGGTGKIVRPRFARKRQAKS